MGEQQKNSIVITPCRLRGAVAAPPSKSHTHRLLVAAALSEGQSRIENAGTSADIEATAGCLRALGARVIRLGADLAVTPIGGSRGQEGEVRGEGKPAGAAEGPVPLLDCGESGTTLRFMTPLAAALCDGVRLVGSGRINERPMEELLTAMGGHGTRASSVHTPLTLQGKLQPGVYELPGNVSSQYISGLLFALPLLAGDSKIRLTTALSSSGYVAMTLDVLKRTGIIIEETKDGFLVPGGQRFHAPARVKAEGDWSGTAFWLAAGAIAGPVTVTGLDAASLHKDRSIVELLRRFGADIRVEPGAVTVQRGSLRGITADLDEIPDLALPLAAVAAFAEGETLFSGCGRLRLKESDRLEAIRTVLAGFGIRTELSGPEEEELHIFGGKPAGCRAESFNDHRVAMMAAVIASAADGQTVIQDPQCVAKSYPDFFADYQKLGGVTDGI